MKKLLILGAGGMVGSAISRAASDFGYTDTLTPSSKELDLCNQADTKTYIADHQVDEVVVAAAKVGGIHANDTYPAEFIYQNVMIAANTVHAAYQTGVNRLLFLGSSCIYPKFAEQPMQEDALLTGVLEPTNEAYAVAKIAGMKLCQYYRKQYGVMFHSAMPTNLYGFGDNYHPENSHVIPALMRRFHEAKENKAPSVTIWGTGSPKREFLHVDDLANGCLRIMQLIDPEDWYNVGCGEDIAILDLAKLVAKVVGFEGQILTDPTKPDGTPRKLMDVSKLKSIGWSPKLDLERGLTITYDDFKEKTAKGEYRQK